MSTDSLTVYTGPWINWSKGLVLGSTITLSSRNGAVLTAFIATFIAIVSALLWKILCFGLHQSRVSQGPKDGLYHQQQNVFRNSGTPGGAAWSFMLQSWHWSGRARNTLLRSLPWVLFSTAYVVVFTVLSIFGSSEVVKAAGQDRLLRGSQCGYWSSDGSRAGESSFQAKVLGDTQKAATYARNCYRGSGDSLGCNTYARPEIKYEGKAADCPFQDGLCWKNHTYQLDTGLIDSHYDLGINTPEDERLKYRRVTTCSVLEDSSHINSPNGSELITWDFGPFVDSNYSFSYHTDSVYAGSGYTVK